MRRGPEDLLRHALEALPLIVIDAAIAIREAKRARRRGLEATSASARLGYLELGARLQKEIRPQAEQGAAVTVIVVGAGAEAIAAWRAAAAITAAPTPDDEALEPPPPLRF